MTNRSESQQQLVQEAARIICEERLTDYRLAKLKAAERLGLSSRAQMPDNALIHEAVIEYQRLFGGSEYRDRLRLLRQTAVQAMRMLAEFQPRLVGAVASGATTDAHLVRLHGFADQPEQLDMFLQDRGIEFDSGERRYRYSDGRTSEIPSCEFTAGEVGVEVAMFPPEELRRPPLSPLDNLPVKRLSLAQVEALIESSLSIGNPP